MKCGKLVLEIDRSFRGWRENPMTDGERQYGAIGQVSGRFFTF